MSVVVHSHRYVCDRFDGGSFLRAELTQRCDDSGRRFSWGVFAAVGLVAYPLGIPTLIFVIMFQHRHHMLKLSSELQRHNSARGTGLNVNQLAKSKHARGSFASLTVEMRWLLPKFDKFKPGLWHTGVSLLVLRLLQTSFMALVRTQKAQAAIMCCVTLVSISM